MLTPEMFRVASLIVMPSALQNSVTACIPIYGPGGVAVDISVGYGFDTCVDVSVCVGLSVADSVGVVVRVDVLVKVGLVVGEIVWLGVGGRV